MAWFGTPAFRKKEKRMINRYSFRNRFALLVLVLSLLTAVSIRSLVEAKAGRGVPVFDLTTVKPGTPVTKWISRRGGSEGGPLRLMEKARLRTIEADPFEPLLSPSASFTSSGSITIASSGNATPYPTAPLTSCSNGACVNVSGMAGAVQNVTVTFNSWNNTGTELSSTFIAVLLQAPDGTAFELDSNACKAPGASSLTLTDAATLHAAPNTTCFSTGNWKPTTNHFIPFSLDNFSAPSPGYYVHAGRSGRQWQRHFYNH